MFAIHVLGRRKIWSEPDASTLIAASILSAAVTDFHGKSNVRNEANKSFVINAFRIWYNPIHATANPLLGLNSPSAQIIARTIKTAGGEEVSIMDESPTDIGAPPPGS